MGPEEPDILQEIFRSVPKLLDAEDVYVEYSDRCIISDKLKTYPIVVTLRYFGNRTDQARTPVNHILDVTRYDDDLIYTKGEIEQTTLSINVYAVDTATEKACDIIDRYLKQLKIWALRDLPEIVEVVSRTGISDLSYLENSSQRRNLDIIFRSEFSYEETVDAVRSIDFTL